MDEEWLIPRFAIGRPFDEQKEMIEKFVRATVSRFPEIEIWTLNEPIAQNCFGWSREQVYDVFVSASKWIHEVNPEVKVMINMIPIQCNWSGLDYDPNEVLDDLIDRGLEADIIGIELYYWWAETEERDENGYPRLDWVESRIDIFRRYNLPILFSEVGVPGMIDGRNQFEEQADWMEAFFRFCHDDEDVIGATWYFVRDDPFMPYAGLTNDDYTYRPVGERLIEIANEWNLSTTHNLNDQRYLDLEPGEYDVIVDQEVFPVSLVEGQAVVIPTYEVLPSLDIKVNGFDMPLTISQEDFLSVTVRLDPGSYDGKDADWWLVANTPFGWYYYNAYEGSWLSGLSFTYQGPLFDLALVEILNIADLPVGTYTFYFGIDTDMNGSLDYDQLYYNAVEVNFSDLIENTTRSGHIYSNELWKGTIDITGDVIIHTPATVTIEPETTIRFAAGSDDQMHGGDIPITDPYFPNDPPTPPSQISSIYVMSGTLYAVGTSDSPIVFTSSASNPERGDWQSIQYGKEGGKLILQHTIIEYGYYGVQINVAADDSNITLKDNIIRHIVACGICGGIDPSQPVTITISGNDISDCGHEAIDTHSNATLVIENNTLHDNLWSYGDGKAGAGVVIDGNNSTIRNNQFIRNRTAIAILTENSHPIISGNSFVDNDLDCDGFCPDPLQ